MPSHHICDHTVTQTVSPHQLPSSLHSHVITPALRHHYTRMSSHQPFVIKPAPVTTHISPHQSPVTTHMSLHQTPVTTPALRYHTSSPVTTHMSPHQPLVTTHVTTPHQSPVTTHMSPHNVTTPAGRELSPTVSHYYNNIGRLSHTSHLRVASSRYTFGDRRCTLWVEHGQQIVSKPYIYCRMGPAYITLYGWNMSGLPWW